MNISFTNFAWHVRRVSRFGGNATTESFRAFIKETAKKRVRPLAIGSIAWRAQTGHDTTQIVVPETGGDTCEEATPYSLERMVPRVDRSAEGRANPKGIPVLYLASDGRTAAAEVRPAKGMLVTVARFEVSRDLRIVACEGDGSGPRLYWGDLTLDELEARAWEEIDEAFSKPVPNSADEHFAEYVPTQFIAEVLKLEGYDGISFRSSLGSGLNYAIFDIRGAHPTSARLFRTDDVTYSFSEDGRPGWMRRHRKRKD